MVLPKSYKRRVKQINEVLNSHSIVSTEEAEKATKDVGLDVYKMVEGAQPICLENAKQAYTVGTATAIKKGCRKAADAAVVIGEGLQSFCIPGSVADQHKVGLEHGNLGKILLEEETDCFCFLAGHESFAAAEGAIGIAEKANKARQKPLRATLNGPGKDAAQAISRISRLIYVETEVDHYTGEVKGLRRRSYPEGLRGRINYCGSSDVTKGITAMWEEGADISITGNSTNPTRFQYPVAGTCERECIEEGKEYFSVVSSDDTGRVLHPNDMATGLASYGMADTMGRMYSDVQSTDSSSVPTHVEMVDLVGVGDGLAVSMTVAVAVLIEETVKTGKFQEIQ